MTLYCTQCHIELPTEAHHFNVWKCETCGRENLSTEILHERLSTKTNYMIKSYAQRMLRYAFNDRHHWRSEKRRTEVRFWINFLRNNI